MPEVLLTNRQDAPHGTAWPGVSIIVPARNKEANLPRLLNSLVTQDYPLYEVIVVDDTSTDGTAAVVRRYAEHGVRLIQSEGPSPGWTGKNAACWLGAGESSYPWLLFVDADTELAPLALRSSVAFALEQGVGALSLFARQRCETFWERLLLPFAYRQYFVGVNAQRVHSARGPALANGQYFLISRQAYQQAGGHAANADSLVDDVALATRLKEVGITPLACRGEALVSVRMYTSLRAIIEGFGKNAYLFLRQSPATAVQTAVSTSLAASVPILFWTALRKRSWRISGLAVLAYFAQALGARAWSRRFGVHVLYTLLAPFSALAFLAIALTSTFRVITGRSLSWKGRSYRSTPTVRVQDRFHLQWMMTIGQALLFNAPLACRWFVGMGKALLFKTQRSIIEDSALAVGILPNAPCVTGTEHIPSAGSFVLVANHYQRLDLWIGWSGTVLIDTIARRRDIAIHFITTDRARIGRFTIPGSRWIIERVAAVWGLVLVTPPAIANGEIEKPHYTLLRIIRLLKRSDGRDVCIGLMPEGDEGNTSGLIDALPGTGRALYALSARGLPILPVGVWESEGRLYAHFGGPFSLASALPERNPEAIDDRARNAVMQRIAALLPLALRGRYGQRQVTDGTLG